MKKILSAIALGITALTGIDCTTCTELGCNDGVDMVVTGFSAAMITTSAQYPVTVKTCVGADCIDWTVTKESGLDKCVPQQIQAECGIGNDGELLVSQFGTVEGNPTVSVEIKDATGVTIYKDSQEVQVQESRPNGDMCEPTCHNGEAKFAIPVK